MTYCSNADLGGQSGHGRVVTDDEREPFHAAWESATLALTLAMGATGTWNIDMSRSARETLPGYAALGYYAIWLGALRNLVVEHGLAGNDELEAGRMMRPPQPVARVLRAADVAGVIAMGSSTLRVATRPARFAVGDRVCTRRERVTHHTRLPAYARGKTGRIESIRGVHVFADANAEGSEQPEWLYTVVFAARELWGDGRTPGDNVSIDAREPIWTEGDCVSIDAWEPYLEPST